MRESRHSGCTGDAGKSPGLCVKSIRGSRGLRAPVRVFYLMMRLHSHHGRPGRALLGALVLLLACDSGTTLAPQLTTVTVVPAAAVLIAIGDSVHLTSQALDEGNNPILGVTTVWSSSDSTVAPVTASGWVKALKNGSATITATVDTVSGTSAITVAQAVTQIDVNPVSETIVSGDSTLFGAVARDPGGTIVSGVTFNWTTSNSAVATVTSGGLAISWSTGTAWIVANIGPARDSGLLTVNP